MVFVGEKDNQPSSETQQRAKNTALTLRSSSTRLETGKVVDIITKLKTFTIIL